MNRRSELLHRVGTRLVRTEIGVIGLVAVRAPVAFELAGVGVDDRNTLVQVAVGQIRLVLFRVDEDLCDAAERHLIVAAADIRGLAVLVGALAGVGVADLQQKLSRLAELQHLRIAFPVAADPHVAFVIDGNAMIRRRPLIAFARTAPMADQRALGIELEHRRRRGAALVRQMRFERLLLLGQRRRPAMNHPDVIAIVNRDTDRRAEHPVVGQRLGPQRVDLEVRRHRRVAALRRHFAGDEKACGSDDDDHQNRSAASTDDSHSNTLPARGDYI